MTGYKFNEVASIIDVKSHHTITKLVQKLGIQMEKIDRTSYISEADLEKIKELRLHYGAEAAERRAATKKRTAVGDVENYSEPRYTINGNKGSL